jgi:hypothetical protein
VRNLFGDKVTGFQMPSQTVVVGYCANLLEIREYWKRKYGPTIAVYRCNEDRPHELRHRVEWAAGKDRSTTTPSTYCIPQCGVCSAAPAGGVVFSRPAA